jgi:hypothetical protein
MNYRVTTSQKGTEVLRFDEIGVLPLNGQISARSRPIKAADLMPGGDKRGNNKTASSSSCAGDENLGQLILL